jgi:hypothetical protein
VELRAAVYGLGRLTFGAALMSRPDGFGALLVGDDAREPSVRAGLRAYGTRDTVLGLATLRAVLSESDVRPWIAAGIASDLLDTLAQALDWSDLPPDRRVGGVAAAAASAAVGIALLARA